MISIISIILMPEADPPLVEYIRIETLHFILAQKLESWNLKPETHNNLSEKTTPVPTFSPQPQNKIFTTRDNFPRRSAFFPKNAAWVKILPHTTPIKKFLKRRADFLDALRISQEIATRIKIYF